MKQNIKKVLLVSIVFTIFFAVIGLSYAYMRVQITENSSSIITKIGSLKLNFVDGNYINATNILGAWTDSKTITVTNTGTQSLSYNLLWEELTNTIVNKDLLTYRITSTDGGKNLNKTAIPNTGQNISILSDIFITPGTTHTYIITFEYEIVSEDQSSDMEKEFTGKLKITGDSKDWNEYCTPDSTRLNCLILADNSTNGKTIRTVTSDTMFENVEPSIISYNDMGFVNNSSATNRNLSSTYTARYFTYGTGYTYNTLTDRYTLTGVNYGKYSDIYSTLNNGSTTDIYVVSTTGSNANEAANSSNISTIFKVRAATYDSSTLTGTLTFSNRIKPTIDYDYSQTGLWLENRAGKTEENKPVYFFRGAVQNNYVTFADNMWRIVRINEDGSIKLVLGGFVENDGYGGYGGPTTTYNPNYNAATYVDYSLSTNALKAANEDWYSNSNVIMYADESYIADTKFCNDKTLTTDANGVKYFGGFSRLSEYSTDGNFTLGQPVLPQYKCPNASDNYIYKIGALTADEVAYAGGTGWGDSNLAYYLYENAQSMSWWLLTPFYFGNYASVTLVSNSGMLSSDDVDTEYSFRPVISLNANVEVSNTFEGTGINYNGHAYEITPVYR